MTVKIAHLPDESHVFFPYRIRANTVNVWISFDDLREIAEYYEDEKRRITDEKETVV